MGLRLTDHAAKALIKFMSTLMTKSIVCFVDLHPTALAAKVRMTIMSMGVVRENVWFVDQHHTGHAAKALTVSTSNSR